MNDIMVDLETLGNTSNTIIVSIGAVQSNLITGEIGDTFYRVIDLERQQRKGRTIDISTMVWWTNQSEGARAALLETNRITLQRMCISFNRWLYSIGSPELMRLWGNGASFDNAILRDAFYHMIGKDLPIPFWNDRDMRTIVGFYPTQLQKEWKLNNLRKGTYHNALDDAKYQIKYCSHILQELGVEQLY